MATTRIVMLASVLGSLCAADLARSARPPATLLFQPVDQAEADWIGPVLSMAHFKDEAAGESGIGHRHS